VLNVADPPASGALPRKTPLSKKPTVPLAAEGATVADSATVVPKTAGLGDGTNTVVVGVAACAAQPVTSDNAARAANVLEIRGIVGSLYKTVRSDMADIPASPVLRLTRF